MNERNPRVTIGLPVHNGEAYLANAIDSLLSQTFTDFELIICDNASDDGTEAICRSYVQADPRVRYERQAENLGAAANYNRTVDLARGELFKWAAHDDVCRPGFLQRCVDALDRPGAEDVVVAHPRAVLIDADGEVIREDEDELSLATTDPAERFAHVIANVRAANAVFGVFRSAVLARTPRIGGYSASDWMLLAEVALHGRILQVDEILFERRIHDGASLRAILRRGGGKREQVAWFATRHALAKSLVPFDVLTSWVLAGAVLRAPLAAVDRVRALAVIPRVYWRRLIRFHGGRLRQRLRGIDVSGPATIPHTSGQA